MSGQPKSHDTTAQFGASANPVRKFKKAPDWQTRSAPCTQPRDFPANRAS